MTVAQHQADAAKAMIRRVAPFLAPKDAAFVQRVFGKDLDVYRNRVVQYGLSGFRHVLDAGCGYGQWSIVLARENEAVTAIDVVTGRLMFLDALARELNQSNVVIRYSETWNTAFPDGAFDAIFCYGVLFLTPWRETLAEFARLLEPGGRLYVNANGFGWYRHLWDTQHNATPDYDPRLIASQVLSNTLKYERGLPVDRNTDVVIDPADLKDELTRLGFEDLSQGAEGTLVVNPAAPRTAPFFQGEYGGQLGTYEVLATKRG